MASSAYRNHLLDLLADADRLQATRDRLGRGGPDAAGRAQAINRSTVVMCVSAWEAYVEELAREAVECLRPSGVTDPVWAVLTAPARETVVRFNTPSSDQVARLFRTTIGLADVRPSWVWPPVDGKWVAARLQQVMTTRHETAHGVHPRPPVPSRFALELPNFFRNLALVTDAAARDYLVTAFGVAHPWPA